MQQHSERFGDMWRLESDSLTWNGEEWLRSNDVISTKSSIDWGRSLVLRTCSHPLRKCPHYIDSGRHEVSIVFCWEQFSNALLLM
jgi:hypothetical protein